MSKLLPSLLLVIHVVAVPAVSTADPLTGKSWSEQKCSLYELAVGDALGFLGLEGLRPDFLRKNEDFIVAGCLGRGTVCPQTDQEIKFADFLTIMTMNEGMASTFVPFRCLD